MGWLLHGLRGGLVAGLLFVLPGLVALLALYVGLGDATIVTAPFTGSALRSSREAEDGGDAEDGQHRCGTHWLVDDLSGP